MPRIQRFTRPGLVLVLAALVACGGNDRQAPPELDEQEMRLVEETVRMIRLRILSTRDSAAVERLQPGGDLYTKEEREFLLERLSRDSARGEAVMNALHDSLEAMREELFPPSLP